MSTILLVDDDQAIRIALQAFLRKQGVNVLLAADGPAGLRLVGSRSLDAAIIDMFLPGMDGIATIRELVELDPLLPFIAISGKRFTDSRLGGSDSLGMAVRLGATAALQKPFGVAELLSALDQCFARRRPYLVAETAKSQINGSSMK
ncbi:hypothetical protein CO669_18560 [Bradyrhizobium sp. Y36]|uniref:response regulator n=1 Tax=Bradyrhizobium sp. Y36 TaxID=2035447 RepID=UPI000BE8EC3C|nr:response regulator [Bradyrhizobium sp. Y36]PDT88764.1 hypothetical protein CO669_18560 [Bradyrhizobium sp. Y36]